MDPEHMWDALQKTRMKRAHAVCVCCITTAGLRRDSAESVWLQLEPSEEQVLVSSSGDRTASVWDRRKLAPGVKPLATATANNTILSAYFSPAGTPLDLSLRDGQKIPAMGRHRCR